MQKSLKSLALPFLVLGSLAGFSALGAERGCEPLQAVKVFENPTYPGTAIPFITMTYRNDTHERAYWSAGSEDGVCRALGYVRAVPQSGFHFKIDEGRGGSGDDYGLVISSDGKIMREDSGIKYVQIICVGE